MKIKKTEVTNSSIPIQNGFKQTDIGLIPEDWDLKKIKDAFSFTKKPRTLEIDGISEIPFIPMELIPDNKIYVEEFELKRFDSFSSGTYFENGNVLLAKITPSFENGKQAIAKIPYDFGYATTEVIPINELKDVSSKFFLFNYLLKSDVRKTLAGKMEGSTGRQRLPKTVLQDTLIPLPPLPEQKKIAHVLSKIQQAIETQEQIIKTTQELKKALMQKLFTEGLNGEPQKQTEIGPIPESWEVVFISSLGQIITGTTPRTANKDYYNPQEYDFIAPADVGNTKYVYSSEKKISEAGVNVSRPLSKYSVLCVCIGSSIGKVGLTYQEVSTTNQQLNSIVCNKNYNPEFIYYLLCYYADYWRRFASPNPVPILSKGKFEKIEIPATKDLMVQENIAESLSTLDDKIEFTNNNKNILKDLFQTTLNQLMTGQIRVKDIEFKLEETAEAVEGV